ncbi:cytochrome C [Ahniella affigens]|uniref:Cytochrome C n=1 Tax=Ahniella affigens TaxID=2021234 RepID=A0A2P1PMW4_9GAMM|nr:cytochrome c [Ahniella affigens]AVP96186.1 cytochrome C [Ahniella affigens]
MRSFVLLSVLALASSQALASGAGAGDPEAGKARAAVCGACHGPTGNMSVDNNTPKLAGQYEGYLVKALQDYRAGIRVNAIMNPQAAQLKDQDIADLAAYFAAQTGDLQDLSKIK